MNSWIFEGFHWSNSDSYQWPYISLCNDGLSFSNFFQILWLGCQEWHGCLQSVRLSQLLAQPDCWYGCCGQGRWNHWSCNLLHGWCGRPQQNQIRPQILLEADWWAGKRKLHHVVTLKNTNVTLKLLKCTSLRVADQNIGIANFYFLFSLN